MIVLSPDESRVLGVLIEKGFTTPEQYPLSLNAVVNGANQKNNRDPVMGLDENGAFEALEALRTKGLVVWIDAAGSRVNKYRHSAADAMHVRPAELALLAELLLRGPQTLGELRGRASRMAPLESLDVVKGMLNALAAREEPLVRELPPLLGSRAERYVQLLCADLHPMSVVALAAESLQPTRVIQTDRVERLEAEVAQIKEAVRRLAAAVGEPDPFI
jgi:uncharacterized protein YceH (UPF0502 family)